MQYFHDKFLSAKSKSHANANMFVKQIVCVWAYGGVRKSVHWIPSLFQR